MVKGIANAVMQWQIKTRMHNSITSSTNKGRRSHGLTQGRKDHLESLGLEEANPIWLPFVLDRLVCLG